MKNKPLYPICSLTIGKTVARIDDTIEFANKHIASPLERIAEGKSSLIASHTTTPHPKENDAIKPYNPIINPTILIVESGKKDTIPSKIKLTVTPAVLATRRGFLPSLSIKAIATNVTRTLIKVNITESVCEMVAELMLFLKITVEYCNIEFIPVV